NKAAAKRASAVLRELDERAARDAAPAVAATHIEEQVMSLEMPVETPVAETPVTEINERDHAEREAEAAPALEETAAALAAAREQAALEAERAVQRAGAAAELRARDEAEAAREAERRKQASEAEARDRRDGLNRLNQLLG